VDLPVARPSAHDRKFWAAVVDGVLLLQRSVATGKFQTYPRAHALDGVAGEVEWVESKGIGTIHTFSVVHRSFYPELEAPYVIVVVDLAEGVKFMGHLVDCPPEQISIGMPVQVTFRKFNEEVALPCFHPSGR
jgi:hypothetical protein